MKYRRGELEGGAAVAAFVLLLALFIIVYVILLPVEQRDDLLKYDTGVLPGSETELPASELDNISLLAVSPGQVYKFDEETIEKKFGNIDIYSKISEEAIDLRDRVYISKSLFKDNPETLYFRLDNVNMAESLNLYFFIASGSGSLVIELNGQKVFDGKITAQELPIELPKTYLTKDNTLKIGIKSAIFSKSMELKDLYLRYGFAEENKKVRRTFVVTSSENKGIKDAKLKYYLNCVNIEEGLLTISLNNKILSKGRAFCDSAGETSVDIPTEDFADGTNTLDFAIDKGDYILEDVMIEMDVSESSEDEYTFFVEDDDYDLINNEEYDDCIDTCESDYTKGSDDYNDCINTCSSDYNKENVILRMKFDDDMSMKKSKIVVNDVYFNMDTKKEVFSKDISDYVQRGANYIKIIPKNDFEIKNLNIYLEEL
ncbi:MAG: hypothetical protein PHT54_03715 [Candidatus Nanoarchaeia archaeon]|nr:hypothetical protein [Candidatus Nanoarchaeia archaeon]